MNTTKSFTPFHLGHLTGVLDTLTPPLVRGDLFLSSRAYAQILESAVPVYGVVGFGITLHQMPAQQADCYLISDPKIARDYLAGRITESDLLQLWGKSVAKLD